MTSWFQITEVFSWTKLNPLPPGAWEIPYRAAHSGATLSAADRPVYGPDWIDRLPCDSGPPCLCQDVQSFAIWAGQRRLGPETGALLALSLFGGQPESRLDSAFSDAEWSAAVAGLVTAAATLCLAVGDSPRGLELSVPLTTDIVWFLARGALILRWMDFHRDRRLDSTNALPMMPVCLEVCRMATRRIARDEGLSTTVAETFVDFLFAAGEDYKDDTPLNRSVRAEIRSDFATGRVSPALPL